MSKAKLVEAIASGSDAEAKHADLMFNFYGELADFADGAEVEFDPHTMSSVEAVSLLRNIIYREPCNGF